MENKDPTLRAYRPGEEYQIRKLFEEGLIGESRRAEIIELVKSGVAIQDIAERTGISLRRVGSLIRAFNRRGIRALREKKPRDMSRRDFRTILAGFKSNPRNLGYPRDRWSLRAYQGFLLLRHGIKVSVETLRMLRPSEGISDDELGIALPAGVGEEAKEESGEPKAKRSRRAYGAEIAEIRIEAIRLRMVGQKVKGISQELRVPRSTLTRWLRPFARSKDKASYFARLQAQVKEGRKAIARHAQTLFPNPQTNTKKGKGAKSELDPSRKVRLASCFRKWSAFLDELPKKVGSLEDKKPFILRPDQLQGRDWKSFRFGFFCQAPGGSEELPRYIIQSKHFKRFIDEKERQIRALKQFQNPKVRAILMSWGSRDHGAALGYLQDTFLMALRTWNDSIINWFVRERNEGRTKPRLLSAAGRPSTDWLNSLLLYFENSLMKAYGSGDPTLKPLAIPYRNKPYLKDLAVLMNCLFPFYIRNRLPRTIFNRLRHLRLKGQDRLYRKHGIPIGDNLGSEEPGSVIIGFTPPLRLLSGREGSTEPGK